MDTNKRLAIVAISPSEAHLWWGRDGGLRTPTRLSDGGTWSTSNLILERRFGLTAEQVEMFAALTSAVKDADEILVIGHGRLAQNGVDLLRRFWELHAEDVVHHIVGELTTFPTRMSDNQVLLLVQDWARAANLIY